MKAARACLLAALMLAGGRARCDSLSQWQTGIFRGHAVTYRIVGNKRVFQGDMLLDHVTPLPKAGTGGHARGLGVDELQYLWPSSGQGTVQIPYVITSAAGQLNAALSQFNATFPGVIQFVQRTAQADYVNFDFDPNNFSGQCESQVGHVGGEQTTGGSAACNLGTLLHELGHVVGLLHEQSRPDRDTYVTFSTANVIKGSEANFDILTSDAQELGPFDYASVMEYIPFAFSRNGGPVLESIPPGMPLSNLAGYSAADIDAIDRLYGAAPSQVTVTSNPPGLSVVVDGATITTPQSFAWALNSSHSLAVPSNAQTSSGGTYSYGRWNDNTQATHTIKVAPGKNSLAQPKSAPAVTVYTANFVQLAAYTATAYPSGAGSIAASPQPQSYPGVTGQYLVARQAVTLTSSGTSPEQFVTWGGTSAPYSANPKPDFVPDGGVPYAVTAYFSAEPITTVTTKPGGFYFTVDGEYFKAPQSFTADLFQGWQAGSTHTLTGFSPSQPYSINTEYLFGSWSDHGALSHQITVPSGASTITGSFTADYAPIAYANPSCAATVTLTPASGTGFYKSGTKLTVAASPASGWVLTGWTGDLKGTAASQKLTVTDEKLAVANFNTVATPLKVTRLSPSSFVAGASGGTVSIAGTGFTAGSLVFVNNAYRASTFVSSTKLQVALDASDLAVAGAFPVGVSNFPSGAPCSIYGALDVTVLR